MLPSISLGAPPLRLASGAGWRLLVVCADAVLRLWDLQAQKLIVRASLPAWPQAESTLPEICLDDHPFLQQLSR